MLYGHHVVCLRLCLGWIVQLNALFCGSDFTPKVILSYLYVFYIENDRPLRVEGGKIGIHNITAKQ